jgi:hypothetical protein
MILLGVNPIGYGLLLVGQWGCVYRSDLAWFMPVLGGMIVFGNQTVWAMGNDSGDDRSGGSGDAFWALRYADRPKPSDRQLSVLFWIHDRDACAAIVLFRRLKLGDAMVLL